MEASIGHVSRAAGCHMALSALAATARDQTSGGGAKYGKVATRCVFSDGITKNRWYQPSFCTAGGKGPKWSYQPCHPCRSDTVPTSCGWLVGGRVVSCVWGSRSEKRFVTSNIYSCQKYRRNASCNHPCTKVVSAESRERLASPTTPVRARYTYRKLQGPSKAGRGAYSYERD